MIAGSHVRGGLYHSCFTSERVEGVAAHWGFGYIIVVQGVGLGA
jgi:hypothetical protein